MPRRVLVAALAAATIASAQTGARRATNIASILAFPGFYHGRAVVLVGKIVTQDKGEVRVEDEAGSVRIASTAPPPDGLGEVRGEFWDLGRMKPDDPRLAGVDVRRTLGVDPEGTWPRPGEVTAIFATTVRPASPPVAPSIRTIVLHPARYLNERVTVTGQFAGRNLFGDLPDDPAKSRWDFVVRSSDAAIWVSGVQPKGKGFDLALDRRVDTDQWLEVSGTVRQGRGLQWIEVTSGGLALGKPLTEAAPADREPAPRAVPGPPPEVIFSAPTQEETEVPTTTTVRIQFSRDIDATTVKGNVSARYQASPPSQASESGPEFIAQWTGANRVLELRFTKPLEPFRTVVVSVTDGVLGTDRQPARPWTLTFSLGGS